MVDGYWHLAVATSSLLFSRLTQWTCWFLASISLYSRRHLLQVSILCIGDVSYSLLDVFLMYFESLYFQGFVCIRFDHRLLFGGKIFGYLPPATRFCFGWLPKSNTSYKVCKNKQKTFIFPTVKVKSQVKKLLICAAVPSLVKYWKVHEICWWRNILLGTFPTLIEIQKGLIWHLTDFEKFPEWWFWKLSFFHSFDSIVAGLAAIPYLLFTDVNYLDYPLGSGHYLEDSAFCAMLDINIYPQVGRQGQLLFSISKLYFCRAIPSMSCLLYSSLSFPWASCSSFTYPWP